MPKRTVLISTCLIALAAALAGVFFLVPAEEAAAAPPCRCLNQELQETALGTGISCGAADADAKGNALDAAAGTCWPDGLCGECYFTEHTPCYYESGVYKAYWTYHYHCLICP